MDYGLLGGNHDDDPLPAIEALQIQGKATPGQQIQVCGYSINGTTSCKFMWMRGSEVDSMNYIQGSGADQAIYEVTEEDVNLYLAIEVTPIDNRDRKGDTVRVFANEGNKISQESRHQEHDISGSTQILGYVED